MTTITRPPNLLRISAEQFGRMQEAGVFEGQHVELLDGELYEVTKSPPHNYSVDALARSLRPPLEPNGFIVREEKSVEPWEDWWPEPDLTVLHGPPRRYQYRHPGPADIVLLAEVCENSPQDRTVKLTGYATADFPPYWILDLNLRRLDVYSNPVAGAYLVHSVLLETESVDVVIASPTPGAGFPSFGRIAVADLLPQA